MIKKTIHDVARHAGVSIATVSRVINNNYPVGARTREAVMQAIRDTSYFPDASARAMRGNNTFAIGYVISDISNSHFTIIAKTIEDAIGGTNYNMMVCSTGDNGKREEDFLQMLWARKISGLIINSAGENDQFIARISREIPVVLIYRQIDDPTFAGDYVGNDDFDGAYRLARHILELGHRRVGLICGPQTVTTGIRRRDGFLSAFTESGLKIPESMIHYGDFYEQSGVLGAKKLTSVKRRPTLLAVMNNAMALGVMSYLRTSGISVPEDLSFVSYGDIHNRDLLYFQPTILAQNPRKIGELEIGRAHV